MKFAKIKNRFKANFKNPEITSAFCYALIFGGITAGLPCLIMYPPMLIVCIPIVLLAAFSLRFTGPIIISYTQYPLWLRAAITGLVAWAIICLLTIILTTDQDVNDIIRGITGIMIAIGYVLYMVIFRKIFLYFHSDNQTKRIK